MEKWRYRYNSLYREYLNAAIIGVVVLVIYKITMHLAFVYNYYGFYYMGQDTKAIENVISDPSYYVIISVMTFLPAGLIYIIQRSGLDARTANASVKFDSDANLISKCLVKIDNNLNFCFQAIYGMMFCFFSDALESPTKTLQMLICFTNMVTFILLLLRSLRSRICPIPVGKPSLPQPKYSRDSD